MEPLTFLLLLYLLQTPEMRENLRSFLAFYRENRDLFTAFMQNGAPMPENAPSENKDRPQKEVGFKLDEKLLERYLSRFS